MEGSVAVLYSYNEADRHAPLKIVHKHNKLWKKEKAPYSIDFVGGWYDKVWQDAAYVAELANLPSKEELVGKLLYLLNHPVSSLARAIQAIADASASPVVEAPQAEAPAAEEPKVEESAQEVAADESAEEPVAEATEE
ncbi:MAG: hypothetical protein H6765_05685 [Candidatus Peribacteria bacterium]|nr:MAG: hypothetical protein H6765_05685 [Candidatus Peribacteria bacterium]